MKTRATVAAFARPVRLRPVDRRSTLCPRSGQAPNHEELFWIYRKESETVHRRGGCKWALGTLALTALPQGPDQRWSLDFVSDMMADGHRFRVHVVVDDFFCECLSLVVDTSNSDRRVAREFDAIDGARKRPPMIVRDNTTELTLEERGIGWHHIARASSLRSFVESLNGGSRDESLNELPMARRIIEAR
jgi:putative transposase